MQAGGLRPGWLLGAVGLLVGMALAPGAQEARAALAPGDLDSLGAVAKTEGLPLSQARSAGTRVELSSLAVMDRASFVRRASLVAYVIFRRLMPPVQEVVVSAKLPGGATQRLRIRRPDLEGYLSDRLSRSAYEDRIAYATEAAAPPGFLPLPEASAPPDPSPYPAWSGPFASAPPSVAPSPKASSEATALDWRPFSPAGAPLVAFGYSLGLSPNRYDAWTMEYGHPLQAWLDARAGVMALSSFSPLNAWAGAARPVDGLAVNLDLMGTTRQAPGPWGMALEAGLGARVVHGSALGGAPLGPLASSSLRLGWRWQGLVVGLRYPLWRRADDPGASWEVGVGYALPFASFGQL